MWNTFMYQKSQLSKKDDHLARKKYNDIQTFRCLHKWLLASKTYLKLYSAVQDE
jgi:hypothetical protein